MRLSPIRHACLCAALVCATGAATAHEHLLEGRLHWARNVDSHLIFLGNNLSPAWQPYFQAAVVASPYSPEGYWTLPNRRITVREAAGATAPWRCRPTAGRVEVCNYWYGHTGWLGVAQMWMVGEHIVQAVVKLNDTYFDLPWYNTPAWRNLVMCQEIGHTLGLDHVNEKLSDPNTGSCMDYTSNPSGPLSNEFPNAADYDTLDALYQHRDEASSMQAGFAQAPALAAQEPGDDPLRWGDRTHSHHGGRAERYERHLGGNARVVTFVTWTADRKKRHGE